MISLWLSPNDTDLKAYQNVIQSLSERFGTSVFEPHITLHPFIEWNETIEKRFVEEFSNQIPMNLLLSDLNTSYSFYQCLYLKAEKQPFLNQLWHSTVDFFKIENDDYMPHLSLLYGDFDKKVIQSLIQSYKTSLDGEVIFNQIKIVKTGHDIEQWKTIKAIQL